MKRVDNFKKAYAMLNEAQQKAVDTIEGPLLVIAGPGTGKTQLLSARVANILDKTDTLPQNILCLTFTENGAINMRERLSRFIGKDAYDVTISTYHSFGANILSRYSEHFAEDTITQPIDSLGQHEIASAIVDSLSYRDPLKQTAYHIRDLIGTISEMKRALLTPDDLQKIAQENSLFIQAASTIIATTLNGISRMPGKLDKALPYYQDILTAVQEQPFPNAASKKYGSLHEQFSLELEKALQKANDENSTKPLTAWKNSWLQKDKSDHYTLKNARQNDKLASLANVLELYEKELMNRGLYDFDDMILRAIKGLKENDDLRYTLQEQYLYILLDEYQDTNAAQAELVSQITDNPINEGRPNIMAVGDDDQAIYAFQGALYSNMLDFFQRFKDTAVINLTQNYRSHQDVLQTAENVASQIEARLFHKFSGTSKLLTASNPTIKNAELQRLDFTSQPAEHSWVARQIKQVIASGIAPSNIAVLARQHNTLERLTPYLHSLSIPMHYERRENILESPAVIEIITMTKLALCIQKNEQEANSLWPIVLGYDYFGISVDAIWQLTWELSKSKGETSITQLLMSSENKTLKEIGTFFTRLSIEAEILPCEQLLDYITGAQTYSKTSYTSPYKEYYLQKPNDEMITILSHLTVLRTKLRESQKANNNVLTGHHLLALVSAYEAAGEYMLNTSPYNQQADSVQLMTAHKAKGLEFEYVFILSTNQKEWGNNSGASNKLTLPPNLAPTRYKGDGEDERLRLFFVAITRAKSHVYLTNYLFNFDGKQTTRLKYLDEREQEDGTVVATTLPEHSQTVLQEQAPEITLEQLQNNWIEKHIPQGNSDLHDLLQDKLTTYQLSPTHLNTFCDTVYGGPQKFFITTLLKFPSAPTTSGQFGNAIHETLEWLQYYVDKQQILPEKKKIIEKFDEILTSMKLPKAELDLLLERGHDALIHYTQQRGTIFSSPAKAEMDFRNQGVFVDDAHMAGKIDRLEINKKDKIITVVDYKTGKPFDRWKSDAKLHKYRQQLYCYKLLIEGSHTYKGYSVNSGRLEFIEPDENGICHALTLDFKEDEVATTKQLIHAMWQKVHTLDFPTIDNYSANIAGMKQFEQDLIDKKI